MSTAQPASGESNSAHHSINKQEIIHKALQFVDEYGWNDECLVRAVKDMNLAPLTHRIVTRGAAEMVQQVLTDKLSHVREAMKVEYPEGAANEFDGERLKVAIEKHIDYLKPFHGHWSEALAVSLTPSELCYTTANIFQLSDDLCYFGGIRATRIDWYYERAIVTGLYTATELFWLTDHSENFQETRSFLERNMEHYRAARSSPLALRGLLWRMATK
jgi:ubiquinone biosynthesis protein COQ9